MCALTFRLHKDYTITIEQPIAHRRRKGSVCSETIIEGSESFGKIGRKEE